ncbi:hypothetical protein Glove_87g190 [Diversispora epigaea]|uniref:Uncharacterized protein n=1 Tax=Diversispora epigaea TaxID=1348612 RepID=A0A397JGW9_9GLOM|nr:hypothetical protein Glove_87g190 [Diversispora epigaea]
MTTKAPKTTTATTATKFLFPNTNNNQFNQIIKENANITTFTTIVTLHTIPVSTDIQQSLS